MNMNRRSFIGSALASAGAATLAGCGCGCPCKWFKSVKLGQPAVQLYSIREYIGGKRDGSTKGVGLDRALEEVAKLGYKAVEFAGYYGHNSAQLAKMLRDNGLVACGTHIGHASLTPERIEKTMDFEMGYGNNFLCVPGGLQVPKDWKGTKADYWKKMADLFSTAAETAATRGCLVGYHNHSWEHLQKTEDGVSMWEYFFSNASKKVQMEQDVGWTASTGIDPTTMYAKFPHRSFTLHAKENGAYVDEKGAVRFAPKFEAILGQPGKFEDGKTTVAVDWDKLFPVTDADGVKWYVVECERNAANLDAIRGSIEFLRSKGRC